MTTVKKINMNKATLEKQQDGTIKLTIIILKEDIKKVHEETLSEYAKNAKVDGFRKGKAPQSLILDKVDNEKVKEEVFKKLLPQAYSQAIQANNIKPIMNPKIHIEKMDEDKNWEFTALTCEMPDVDLGAYKESVKKITVKSKIIIPGQEQKKPENTEVIKALLESVKTKIPGILVEQEADRLLSQLLNDIKKLGLSLDQYLASTNRTPEDIRAEYGKRAEEDMKLEFALQRISETEKIVIGQKEIDEAIQKAKDDDERKSLESNRYLLASILRQQKTLDFLLNL
jgi:FKBP-type peptidyl-prolyl cis-trans isomerase (trigger factor)